MSEKKRPNYTKEFKQNAIKLVIEQWIEFDPQNP